MPEKPAKQPHVEADSNVGAWELSRQLGQPMPTDAHATSREREKRDTLRGELEAAIAAPLISNRKPEERET